MKKNASTNLISSKTVIGVLVIIAVIFALYLLFRSDVGQRFKNIFPDWFPKNETPDFEYSLTCPIKSAIIVESNRKYIEICNPPDCADHRPSGFYLEDNLIKKTGSGIFSNSEVGQITRGNLLIYPEILDGVGSASRPDLYYNIKDTLPPLDDLLVLHSSYFYSDKEFCRDSIIKEKDWKINQVRRELKIPTEFISSGVLHYNVDELIENKGKTKTNLYRDSSLKILANSWIGEDWVVHYVDEESKGQAPGITGNPEHFIDLSNEDVSWYVKEQMIEGKIYGEPYYLLGEEKEIDNKFNKLGLYSNGQNYEAISFMKTKGNVYIKLYSFDGKNTQTFWFRMDYWNAHRNAARIPRWALA